MPLIPEEPQIHESVPGPRTAPATGRSASTPRPVPGPPRPAAPRPAPPRESAAGVGPGRQGPARPAAPTGSAAPSGPVTPAAAATPPTVPQQRAGAASAGAAQIQLIPAPADGALDAAEETVDLLLDTGRAPGEILVLTTGDPHPWAVHELSFGEASYWAQHDAADDVFYAAISAERAAGRPVVVVALNGGDDETLPRALAGALSRAGVLLIVCGDPTRINALLGASA
ncbi:hypothetical protein AB0M29_22130 [Streptomyces sp. NPDC051976]|uniref:hypothetical protein n=1 Tax=Streptomyces sp. NPDC051976 TaxID=3154947 RepID=UPI00343A8534